MADEWTVSDSSMLIQVEVQKPSEWQCEMCGQSYVFIPKEGDEPNWFWRKMQYLVFGFRWVRPHG